MRSVWFVLIWLAGVQGAFTPALPPLPTHEGWPTALVVPIEVQRAWQRAAWDDPEAASRVKKVLLVSVPRFAVGWAREDTITINGVYYDAGEVEQQMVHISPVHTLELTMRHELAHIRQHFEIPELLDNDGLLAKTLPLMQREADAAAAAMAQAMRGWDGVVAGTGLP